MTDQLISFETAKLAKEKGFGWNVWHYYENGELKTEGITWNWNQYDGKYSSVSQSLLQRWLREVHKIYVSPMFIGPDTNKFQYRMDIDGQVYINNLYYPRYSDWFDSYEEALEAGLVEALTIVTKPF